MATADADLAALLSQHSFLTLNERGKVHCAITNHDMPARADTVRAHLAGKKFAKARDWYVPANDSLDKYGPWVVAHKSNPKKAFCRLTGLTLNRIPEEIEAHMSGRRFKYWRAHAEKHGAAPEAGAVAAMGADDEDDEDEDEEEEDGGAGDDVEMERRAVKRPCRGVASALGGEASDEEGADGVAEGSDEDGDDDEAAAAGRGDEGEGDADAEDGSEDEEGADGAAAAAPARPVAAATALAGQKRGRAAPGPASAASAGASTQRTGAGGGSGRSGVQQKPGARRF